MKYKVRIISVIGLVILANLMFANFALGQTPAPTPPPTGSDIIPGLNTDGWNKAQADKTYCLGEFKDSIYNYSNHLLKTVYNNPDTNIDHQSCYIVVQGAPDAMGMFAGSPIQPQYRPMGVQALETTIKNSPKGISKQAAADSATEANNEQQASGISQAIGYALDAILGTVAAFLGLLASIAGGVFNSAVGQVLAVNSMPGIVNIGWMVVRDICNMFFILALIVMALATILQIGEEYNYKRLLPKLVLAALLVNFSLIISVTIMNAVNFLASIFVVDGLGPKILAKLLAIANPVNDASNIFHNGWQAGFVLGLGKVLFMLVAAVVFIALAGMFVIRLVGLYVLIIFAPVAYVASILPATAKYGEEWWSHFIKYLIWAPVALFMIRLAILFVSNPVPGDNDTAFYYFIVTAFLAAALLVAQQAGMVGGDMIVNGVKKGFKGAGKLAWFGTKAGANLLAEKYLEKTGREIRPAKWIEGWKESRQINREARETSGMTKALEKGSALASPTTFFQRYMGKGALARMTGGGQAQAHEYQEEAKRLRESLKTREEAGSLTDDERTNLIGQIRAAETLGLKLQNPEDYFTQKKIRHAMDEEKKNIHTDNWHELVDMFNSAVSEGKQARASAIMMHLTDTYNENELINKSRYSRTLGATESADGKAHEKGEFFEYSTAGAENFRKLVLDEQLGLGDQGSKLVMSDVSDLAEQRGHRTLMRMYETEHGRLIKKSEKDIQAEQAGENAKMDDSKVLRDGHRLMFYNEKPSADYDINGKRETVITPAGLTYYVTNYQAVKNRVNRNEMNASQAKAAAQNSRAIFAAAANIHDETERREYQEVMSALVDFGRSKMAEAGEDSRLDTVYNRFTGSPPSPLTSPGEDIASIPGYVPDLVAPDGKVMPGGRAYLHKKV